MPVRSRKKSVSVSGPRRRRARKRIVKKKWIQDAIKKPGALSKTLGVPVKDDIPMSKLEKAAKNKRAKKTAARARLAITLKKMAAKRKKRRK